MKNSVKAFLTITTLGLALAAIPTVNAQQGPGKGRGPSVEERVKSIDEAVKLTDDQKTKVTDLLKKQQEQMQALRKDESLSREDRRSKIESIMKETTAAIRAVLTSEQQPKFDAMPRPGRGGPKPAEK